MGIALTFDDGPHPDNTPKLLEILSVNNVKATFFVVGKMAKANPGVLRRIFGEKHQVCNHSWSHPNFKNLSDDQVRAEVQDTQKLIEDTLGLCFRDQVLRPPYGAITKAQRTLVKDLGFVLEGWNVDPLDWKFKDAAKVAKAILDGTKDGQVVLSHDIHKTTVEAMKTVIPGLKAKTFTLGTISQLNLFTTSALG